MGIEAFFQEINPFFNQLYSNVNNTNHQSELKKIN